jgi:hypothetical protein
MKYKGEKKLSFLNALVLAEQNGYEMARGNGLMQSRFGNNNTSLIIMTLCLRLVKRVVQYPMIFEKLKGEIYEVLEWGKEYAFSQKCVERSGGGSFLSDKVGVS